MKILFKYMNFVLGELSYENNRYIYNSNIEEEQKAKRATFGLLDYRLYNSINKTSNQIFIEFLPFINQATRPDIKKECHIENNDNDFQKLIKMATNNISMGAYSISIF